MANTAACHCLVSDVFAAARGFDSPYLDILIDSCPGFFISVENFFLRGGSIFMQPDCNSWMYNTQPQHSTLPGLVSNDTDSGPTLRLEDSFLKLNACLFRLCDNFITMKFVESMILKVCPQFCPHNTCVY